MRRDHDSSDAINSHLPPVKVISKEPPSSEGAASADIKFKVNNSCDGVSLISPTQGSSTENTETLRSVTQAEFLSSGKKVTFSKVLDFFHVRNLVNITSDEGMYVTCAYFHGIEQANHLAVQLHWDCERLKSMLSRLS